MGRIVGYAGLVALVAIVSGCVSYEARKYAQVDLREKTMIVPAGGLGLFGSIKDQLTKSGWTLTINTGERISEPVPNQNAIINRDAGQARYKIVGETSKFDICIVGGGAYFYDISLIDLKNRTEVFTISGRGCESEIVKSFMDNLNGG